MKAKFCYSTGFVTLTLLLPAAADTLYSNFQNLTIPATFDGLYLDVDGPNGSNTSMQTPVAGWDINPLFGGQVVANSPAFQPVRLGTTSLSSLANLAAGSVVGVGSVFSTFQQTGGGAGYGGSETHLGSSFTANTEGYLGFRLNDNYGWMRVVFTDNAAGAVIKDWAYDTSGAPIVVGQIQQAAAVGNTQLVALSPDVGKSISLGSTLADSGVGGSVVNRVEKTGLGVTTLTGNNSYSGGTILSEGTLLVNNTSGSGTGSGAVVVTGGTLGGTGSIAGTVTLNGGTLAPGASIESLTTGALTMTTGTTFAYEMNSTVGSYAADLLVVTGGVALSGTVRLGLTDMLGGAATRFANGTILTLINYASTLSGGFFYGATPTLLGEGATFTAGLNTWKINYGAASGGLNAVGLSSGHFINLTAIPEPGSWLALGCLVGSGMMLRSRRRN
jgi:autotransporter-associated beta strand protein